MKPKIFISYRRDTSFELAKSICRELEKRKDACFFDVKSIKAGDFYQIILSKMDECDIFLLLVSETTFDRCNDPGDYVRLEIEAALERNLTIVPVMIEKAEIPANLPPSLEPIRKAHQLRYIREYSDEIYPMIFQAVDSIRGEKKSSARPVLAVLAVVVLIAAFLIAGPLRSGSKKAQEPAASTAAETEAPAEGESAADASADAAAAQDEPANTESVSDEQADATSTQDEQILPDDFLVHMEELAEERLQMLTRDNGYITIQTDDGTFDIDARYISVSDAVMSKEALYVETGGTTSFYLCCEADVQIDESWSGFDSPTPPESSYQDAAIVFALKTMLVRFLDEDGNPTYADKDFQFSSVYTSVEDFEVLLQQDLRYVDHDTYRIQLP